MQEPAGSEATSAQEGEIAHGSTIDKELSAQAAQAEGLALHALPPTVLRKVLLHLNPGNAIQLALSSKQLRQAVMFESSGSCAGPGGEAQSMTADRPAPAARLGAVTACGGREGVLGMTAIIKCSTACALPTVACRLLGGHGS